MSDETPATGALTMDRGLPIGNSEDIDGRRALHVKIKNTNSEPINISAVIASPDGIALESTQLEVEDHLDNIDGHIDVNLSTRAADTTLQSTNTKLDTVHSDLTAANTHLTAIDSHIDVNLSTRAADTTVQATNTKLDTIHSDLSTTNTKLTSIDGHVDVNLSTRATETTLSSVNTHTASIDSHVDVNLSTRAADTTLQSTNTKLDTVHSDLTTIDTDIKASQPRKLQDGSGNPVTSQISGGQRALDVGIDVAGVQVDPRQVRALTSSDVVTANQGSANTIANAWPVKITDGTNTVAPTSSGSVLVSGLAAVGSAPSLNPVSISGVDTNGNKQHFQFNENAILATTTLEEYYSFLSKAFIASTPLITMGTAETAFVLFRNPNGSGKTVKIYEFRVTSQSNTSGLSTFRIYNFPTVTANGTTVTPQNRKIVSGTQGNVSLVTSQPTVSANGSLSDLISVSTASSTSTFTLKSNIVLSANTSILITTAMASNNTPAALSLEWLEI